MIRIPSPFSRLRQPLYLASPIQLSPRRELGPALQEGLGSLASKVEPHITAMSNSAQLRYILWIDKAKKPETRGRRIAEAVRHLIQEAD